MTSNQIYRETIPFTYLIGWSSINKFYYGVKWANGCKPSDLWTSYFTSSKSVAAIRKIFGEPDIIQIRKTFKDSKSARIWEFKVNKRLTVRSEKFLNKAAQNSLHSNKGMVSCIDLESSVTVSIPEDIFNQNRDRFVGVNKGRTQSDEEKLKNSFAKRGRVSVKDLTTGQGIRISIEDANKSPERYEAINKGRKHSEKARKNMSDAQRGKVNVRDVLTNETKCISKEEFDFNRERYQGAVSGTVACFDIEKGAGVRITKEEYHELKNIRYFAVKSKAFKNLQNSS